MALALVAVFTMPAAAADKIKFYGNIKMYTHTTELSKEQNSGTADNETDTDLTWELHGSHTNFGARIETGALKARVEIPFNLGGGRHWYVTWDFGPALLLIGNTSSIEHMSVGKFEPGTDWGGLGGSNRDNQIQLRFKVGPARIKLAAETPPANAAGINSATNDEIDQTLPKLGARVEFGVGPLKFDLAGVYHSYEERATTANTSTDIDSNALLSRVVANFGPIELAGNLWTATNLAQLKTGGGSYSAAGLYAPTYYNNALHDSEDDGWMVRGTFKFNKMISINVQTGETTGSVSPAAGVIDNEKTRKHFGVSLPITLVKGITVMPMYEKEEYEVTTAATVAAGTQDQGDIKYIGAIWIIKF